MKSYNEQNNIINELLDNQTILRPRFSRRFNERLDPFVRVVLVYILTFEFDSLSCDSIRRVILQVTGLVRRCCN